MKLLVATGNPGKLREYREMLNGLDVDWVGLGDVGLGDMDVAEAGTTFEANARIKAEAYGKASGLLTLADDSGLVVDALNGAPGVYSARYGSPEVTSDEGRYQKLLQDMYGIEQRSARFVCVVAIFAPDGGVTLFEGKVEGHIAHRPRGSNGFGYDPLFVFPERGVTMAELTSAEKNAISHRGRAARALAPEVVRLVGGETPRG
jgi:XTP/dITP diphosphohydrolase